MTNQTKLLQKHTLLLFQGEFDKLRELHPQLPPSEVIRTLVRNHITKVVEGVPTPKMPLELAKG